MNNASLDNFLMSLGLSKDESLLFSVLIQRGPLTILSLSRLTSINRTKIYRLVERLEKIGLVQEIVEENKTFLKAVDLHQLELLVEREEEKAKYLRSVFPEISSLIPTSTSLSQPSTKVIFYRGIDGIRQQGWNTLRAKKECLGFTYRLWTEVVGEKFAKDWAEEWITRKLHFREIYCDELIKSKKQNPQLKGITYDNKYFSDRYISSKILNINHQIDIYNDVVSIYNWYEGEIFGIEIYNEKVASLQKQLFEIVWKIAKKAP